MPTPRATHAATAVLLITLPLGLTACSSGSSAKTANSSGTPSSTRSSATSGGAAPSASSGSSGAATRGGKPSKAQVAAGMSDYFVGQGVPRSLVSDVSRCVADKGYSTLSDDTLRALRNGKFTRVSPTDSARLTKVITQCLASGSLPSGIG